MSSASLRHFFISDDNEIFRIPNAKFERLLKGSLEKKTERFAGKRVRTAEIVVKLEILLLLILGRTKPTN